MRLFREILPEASLAAVHVLPRSVVEGPAPQTPRHDGGLFETSPARSRPDRRLHFWTDVQEYFEATLELVADRRALVRAGALSSTTWITTPISSVARECGKAVYRAG
jgi:hypothetical protein